jgi:hypothetical protein
VARINTIMRGSSRFYVNPETRVKMPGVTSIIGMLPKEFLGYWRANEAAKCAVRNVGALVTLAMNDEAGAIDFVKGAAGRYTKERAQIGSDAHDVFERMARGENVRRVHPDIEPYRAHFAEFLDKVQPEFIRMEDIAWSDTHAYAGSFDALCRIEGEVVMLDYKTSKATYPDVSLQLSAYSYADKIVDPDGNEFPMPTIDAGAVLHVTQDQWALKPVEVSEDVFSVFLALRQVFDWERERSKSVIGRPVESGGAAESGTQRRAK